MNVHVCVPVLRRYDLLSKLLASLETSTIQPAAIYVINNGTGHITPRANVHVYTPDIAMGVAESWNWFLRNVPEHRIICNDDIQFSPHSIDLITSTPGDLVFMDNCGFSCFRISDRCVSLVGEFDEAISPGYAYYEDVDYAYRMIQVLPPECRPRIDAGIAHVNSSTWKAGTAAEIDEHWRRFSLAKKNFEKKWGFTVESLAGIV
jgi:hypothetical protein